MLYVPIGIGAQKLDEEIQGRNEADCSDAA